MRSTVLPLAAMAALSLAAPAAAQHDSSEEWLAHCRSWDDDNRATFCEVRESRTAASGTVRVDGGANGGAIVRAYEGREVIVRARVQATSRTQDEARALARTVRIDTDGTIHAAGPESARGRWWSVTFEVLVPARTNLELVAVNGPVSVEGVTGRMNLRTTNGPVNLTDVGGDVTARTTNGPLNVTLDGERWAGGSLDAETTNGPVNLRLPRRYAAHLETGNVHGPMRIDFPVTVPSGRRDHRVSADLNGGGPTLRAVTTNGPVSVRYR